MTKFIAWIRSLRQPFPWIVGGAIVIFFVLLAVTVGATGWEYTNSPEFCGTTCHTMPPEYTAYQVSPHARVACVDCHLGQDSILLTVPRKAKELRHVVNALTHRYEPPIYVKSLRPARDTCEKCHNPEKFSSDTFVEIKRFAQDAQSTENSNFMIIKTGGGSEREGLGRGIHWHIENEVWYYSDDPLKQTIPYVREIDANGEITEYFDVEAELPANFGQTAEGELQRMDCIDCHTRISHLFRSPADAMDDAMGRNLIDRDIPYIKTKGVEVMAAEYATPEEGMQAIENLAEWYQINQPIYYAQNQERVEAALEEIKNVFRATVFPNMDVGWQTHPNNIGHKEFPGCFRCHDGKHTSPQSETIRLECNLCHSIPEVVRAGEKAAALHVAPRDEPESHKDSNWLARHRYVFDETCIACHDVSNPGGLDNSSFCANSACHGVDWRFVGLNAPAIHEIVRPPATPGSGAARQIPHPIGPNTECSICHSPEGIHPYPEDHASFDQWLCVECHQPSLEIETKTEEAAAPVEEASPVKPTAEAESAPAEPETPASPGVPVQIPHELAGRDDCLTCHGPDGFKPYPADHAGRPSSTCLACHQLAPEVEQVAETTETPAPTKAATATPARPAATPTEEATAAATATSTPAEEPTAEAVTPEPTGEAATTGIPAIPHPIEGREDICLVCHAEGGDQPVPADHAGRTNEICLACHQVAE